MKGKDELKKILNNCLFYINAGSPLSAYHSEKYQKRLKNLIYPCKRG